MESMMSSASQMQQMQTAVATQTAVAKKSLNTQREIGETILSMIDAAAMLPTGKSLESGQNLDLFA